MRQYKKPVTLIILIFLTLIFVLALNAGEASVMGPKEKKDQIVTAESVEKLIELIESALESNDSKRLEQIKTLNTQLVADNKRLTIRECGTLLDKAIKEELTGEKTKVNSNFQVCRILAEIYRDAADSSYLLDKVSFLQGLSREKKEKYLKAEELYTQGKKPYEQSKYDLANNIYNKSLMIYREINYKQGEAKSMIRLADTHFFLSGIEKAEKWYQQTLELYREVGDQLGEADCLLRVGDAHIYLSEFEKAKTWYKQSQELYHQINDKSGEANCLLRLADINRMMLFMYKEAGQQYKEALNIFRELRDKQGEAKCLRSMGDMCLRTNNLEKSREFFEKALELFRETNNSLGESGILLRFGILYQMWYKYDLAEQYYIKALTKYREINYQQSVVGTIQRVAEMHRLISNYEKSKKLYEEALEIARQFNDRRGMLNSFFGLGLIHIRLIEFEKAKKRCNKCLELSRELKSFENEAKCLHLMGRIHYALSEFKPAVQWYEKSLKMYRDMNDRFGEANELKSLGFVYNDIGEYEKAEENYEEAMKIYRKFNNPTGEANCLAGLGEVYYNLANYKKARNIFEKAFLIQNRIENKNGILWSYYGLGITDEAQKNYTSAEENYKKGIILIEKIWDYIKIDEHKTGFMASKVQVHEALINLLFEQGRGAEAFSYAERSKARTLLYLMGNQRIDPQKGIPPELAREEEELRQKIAVMMLEIRENEEKEKKRRSTSEKLKAEIFQLKQRHSEILDAMKLQSPEYTSLKLVNPLPVEEIQAFIRKDNNTVMIEYCNIDKFTFLWLLDGKHIYSFKIDLSTKELDEIVRDFRKILTDGASKLTTLKRSSRKLYNLLLKPMEKHIRGKSRIAVVPHGSLHYLPFETLVNKGKFLVEQGVSFFYLPSASVYKYCRDKNSLKKEYLMSIGNPDGTLPLAEKEIKEINRLYQKNAKIFIGKDAKESTIKKNASHPDLLHFACHGRFDSKHPMYSALILAPDTNDDGRLEVSEIFNLKLKPAYLVTLSACETNMGKMYHGDEIVGLSRAFIYAGTPSIVTSLWDVDDYYTMEFMTTFYRELKTNDKIDALNIARKAIIQNHGKRHPFYWAAFVLIGDPR